MRLLVLSAALLTFAVAACSSDDQRVDAFNAGGGGGAGADDGADVPEAPRTKEEEDTLAALDIPSDEPIGDEDEASIADPVTGDRADEQDATGAVDNPIPDDADEEGGFDLSVQSVQGGLHLNAEPSAVNIKSRKWKCRQKTKRACVCEGSPMNCELPNDQPGRNRYIPTTKVDEIQSKGGDKEKHIDQIGRWGIEPGTPLYDGNGALRGSNVQSACYDWNGNTTKQIDGTCAKLNFGQRKKMTVDGQERTFVYAFAVSIGGKAASSWIPQSAVKSDNIKAMRTVKNPAVGTLVSTAYVVKSATDLGQSESSYRADDLPAWAQAKVAKGLGSRKARDYLLRDGKVINLAYHTPGVGGAATDTLGVGPETLAFQRVRSTKSKPTLVRVKVFDPNKTSMVFAYGRINGRYGWLPLDAIKRGEVKPDAVDPVDPNPCAQVSDGVWCSGKDNAKGIVCKAGQIVEELTCDTGTLCIGAAADGPNGEKRIACQ